MMQPLDYQSLVEGPAYRQASRRVLRQLLEALLFENVLPHAEWNGQTLRLQGRLAGGGAVLYHCRVKKTFSFGRIRLLSSLMRETGGLAAEAVDPSLFLAEMAPWLGAEEARLGQFAAELLATQIKDAQTLHDRRERVLRGTEYDILEARLTDGHPYHPSYKSRLGFTLGDNASFAPEMAAPIHPLLLAARRDRCRWAVGSALSGKDPVPALLAETDARQFRDRLSARGLRPEDYLPLPVHPWQWEEVILPAYHPALARAELVPIGPLSERFLPQQSLRTLGNSSRPDQASLKLAMSLVNTSTSRVLAPHTVQNAAAISDWLHDLAQKTVWSAPMAPPVLLREIAGVAFTPLAPAAGQYGALSCIWRESIHAYSRTGEAAAPMTALLHVDADGLPFVDPWVKRHGPDIWLRSLIECAWMPVLHLLWEHGTALESHAQNMILLHRDGLPARVALKDFHDGVRFGKALLSGPAPAVTAPPPEHARVNPNSFLETDDAEELRDFTFDALFFVNLAELAWLFDRCYGFAEKEFWRIVREVILAHQARHPDKMKRYALFDCFAPEVSIEMLASRRFLPEIRLRTRRVPNPLASADLVP